jgi:hypothetical protein
MKQTKIAIGSIGGQPSIIANNNYQVTYYANKSIYMGATTYISVAT